MESFRRARLASPVSPSVVAIRCSSSARRREVSSSLDRYDRATSAIPDSSSPPVPTRAVTNTAAAVISPHTSSAGSVGTNVLAATWASGRMIDVTGIARGNHEVDRERHEISRDDQCVVPDLVIVDPGCLYRPVKEQPGDERAPRVVDEVVEIHPGAGAHPHQGPGDRQRADQCRRSGAEHDFGHHQPKEAARDDHALARTNSAHRRARARSGSGTAAVAGYGNLERRVGQRRRPRPPTGAGRSGRVSP